MVGGLLGNQIGGGTGKTLATVGGAAAGGYVGNEVQKNVTSKTVWVTPGQDEGRQHQDLRAGSQTELDARAPWSKPPATACDRP